MNVRDDTTSCNGRLDEGVKFFISTNGELREKGRRASKGFGKGEDV